MKLSDLGEFGLIERIRRNAPSGTGVLRGIGDDAAELQLPAGHNLLTSTDLLIEGIHFRRDWTSARALGHKAVAVNLSDIAAMAGTPRFLYLGLACPADADLREIDDFLAGALAEAGRHDVILVGGDTCRSPGPWLISVTVEGSVPAGQSVGRNGGRPGDLIMVTGTLGDSALACKTLAEGRQAESFLLNRHHQPTPRVELGRALGEAGLATAMIDISDGLASDLQHILQASAVDGVIDQEAVPLSTEFKRLTEGNPALRDLALYGGEDYELLFALAPQREAEAVALGLRLGVPVRSIGSLQVGTGRVTLRAADGTLQPLRVRGYDHFCRSDAVKGST